MFKEQVGRQKQLLQQLVFTLEKQIQSKNQQHSIIIGELQHLVNDNDLMNKKYMTLLAQNKKILEKNNQQQMTIRQLEENNENKYKQIMHLQGLIEEYKNKKQMEELSKEKQQTFLQKQKQTCIKRQQMIGEQNKTQQQEIWQVVSGLQSQKYQLINEVQNLKRQCQQMRKQYQDLNRQLIFKNSYLQQVKKQLEERRIECQLVCGQQRAAVHNVLVDVQSNTGSNYGVRSGQMIELEMFQMLQSEYTQLHQDYQQSQSQLNQLQTQNHQLRGQNQSLTIKNQSLAIQIQALKVKIEQLSKQSECQKLGLRENISQLEQALSNKQQEETKLRVSLQEMSNRIDTVTVEFEQKIQKEKNRSLQIMKQHQSFKMRESELKMRDNDLMSREEQQQAVRVIAQLTKQLEQLHTRLIYTEQENTALMNKDEENKKLIQRQLQLLQQIRRIQEQLCGYKQKHDKQKQSIESLKQQLKRVNQDVCLLVEQNTKYKQDNTMLINQVAILKQDNSRLTNQINTIHQLNHQLQKQLNHQLQQHQNEKQQLMNKLILKQWLQNRLSEQQTININLRQQLQCLNQLNHKLNQQCSQLKNQNNQIKQKLNLINQKNSQLQRQYNQLQQKYNQIKEQYSLITQQQSLLNKQKQLKYQSNQQTHNLNHQQNLTINNISHIHPLTGDNYNDDSFISQNTHNQNNQNNLNNYNNQNNENNLKTQNNLKNLNINENKTSINDNPLSEQTAIMKQTIQRLSQQLSFLVSQNRDKQALIDELEGQIDQIQKEHNIQMMQMKKTLADTNSQLLKCKIQLFSYQSKDPSDIIKFIQNNLQSNHNTNINSKAQINLTEQRNKHPSHLNGSFKKSSLYQKSQEHPKLNNTSSYRLSYGQSSQHPTHNLSSFQNQSSYHPNNLSSYHPKNLSSYHPNNLSSQLCYDFNQKPNQTQYFKLNMTQQPYTNKKSTIQSLHNYQNKFTSQLSDSESSSRFNMGELFMGKKLTPKITPQYQDQKKSRSRLDYKHSFPQNPYSLASIFRSPQNQQRNHKKTFQQRGRNVNNCKENFSKQLVNSELNIKIESNKRTKCEQKNINQFEEGNMGSFLRTKSNKHLTKSQECQVNQEQILTKYTMQKQIQEALSDFREPSKMKSVSHNND